MRWRRLVDGDDEGVWMLLGRCGGGADLAARRLDQKLELLVGGALASGHAQEKADPIEALALSSMCERVARVEVPRRSTWLRGMGAAEHVSRVIHK